MQSKGMTNLAIYVDNFLYQNRYNKSDIARQLGLTRQGLYNLLHKPSFNDADANRILNAIGYKVDYSIVPLEDNIK